MLILVSGYGHNMYIVPMFTNHKNYENAGIDPLKIYLP